MFSSKEIQRYSSQIILPEIGAYGQQKLKNAKILIIGCGGLGSVASLYLASAGIGFLSLVDHDKLELSNLHRQILYETSGIGSSKVTLAAQRLKKTDPNLKIKTYLERFDFTEYQSSNSKKFKNHNLILDCSDNMKTKKFTNQLALYHQIPAVFAAAIRWSGSLFSLKPFESACYNCLYPANSVETSCDELGVVGPLVGAIGCFQALEAIKILIGRGNCFNQLLFVDGLQLITKQIKITRKADCSICSKSFNKL